MTVVNTNIKSLVAANAMAVNERNLQNAMTQLSTGSRINSARDDAAGLAISQRFTAQINGLNQAARNANDGISLVQTAEGAMAKVGDALQRMRELAVQSRNASNSNSDKDSLDKEFGELAKEIQRVLGGTTFNGKAVLATAAAGTQTFQVGANTTGNDRIDIVTTDMTTDTTITTVAGSDNQGTGRAVIDNTATGTTIDTVISNIDTAINKVSSERATLGASQNRLDQVISNLQISVENQTAARSRIMDADFASETANLSRAQILQQAGNAMVAQAKMHQLGSPTFVDIDEPGALGAAYLAGQPEVMAPDEAQRRRLNNLWAARSAARQAAAPVASPASAPLAKAWWRAPWLGGLAATMAALAVLKPEWRDAIAKFLTAEQDLAVTNATVAAGAVDGVTARREPTVDGFGADVHGPVVEKLRRIACGEAAD